MPDETRFLSSSVCSFHFTSMCRRFFTKSDSESLSLYRIADQKKRKVENCIHKALSTGFDKSRGEERTAACDVECIAEKFLFRNCENKCLRHFLFHMQFLALSSRLSRAQLMGKKEKS